MSTFRPMQDLFQGPLHRILGSDRREPEPGPELGLELEPGQDDLDQTLDDVLPPECVPGEAPAAHAAGAGEAAFDEALGRDHGDALGLDGDRDATQDHGCHDDAGTAEDADEHPPGSHGSGDAHPPARGPRGRASRSVTDRLRPGNVPDYIQCTRCHETLPKQQFVKNGLVMRTCSKHRVTNHGACLDYATFLHAVEQGRERNLEPFRFDARIPMSSFPPLDAVKHQDDTSTRTRAVKTFLNEVHHRMGYRFQICSTWFTGATWRAKCMCVQDKQWAGRNAYKTKDMVSLSDAHKYNCQSSLTLRLQLDDRTFDLSVEHGCWHPCPLRPKSSPYELPTGSAAPVPARAPAVSALPMPLHNPPVALPRPQPKPKPKPKPLLQVPPPPQEHEDEVDGLEQAGPPLRPPSDLGTERSTPQTARPPSQPPTPAQGAVQGVTADLGSGSGRSADSAARTVSDPQAAAPHPEESRGLSGIPQVGSKRPRPASFGQPSHPSVPPDPMRRGSARPSLPPPVPPLDVVATPNSDSFNYCLNILRRGANIMEEFREYMCEDDNFQQFRQFFTGIESFVNAYEADAHHSRP